MEIRRTTNNLPHSEFSGRCRLLTNVLRKMAPVSENRTVCSRSVRFRSNVLLLGTCLTVSVWLIFAPAVHGQRPLGNSTFGASHNSSGVINVHPVLTTSTTSTEAPRSMFPASASGFEDSFEDDSSDLEEHDHDEHEHHHHEHGSVGHSSGSGGPGGGGGIGAFPQPNEMNAGASRNGGHDGAPIGSRQPGSRLINPYFPTPASTQGGSKTTEPQNVRQFNPARPGRGRKQSSINVLHKMNKASTNMNGLDSGGEPISYGSTTHRRGQTVHHAGANAYGQENAGERGTSGGASGTPDRTDARGSNVQQGGRGAVAYGNRGRSDPGRGVGVVLQSPGYSMGGSSYSRQGDDPLRTLRARYNEERYHNSVPDQGSEMDEILGMKCNFETECAWTWDENDQHGFQVVTGMNLTESNRTGLMPGPGADPAHNANGHFLHLRLTQDSQPQILTSPVFGATKENCYLEVFTHQSAMHHGSIRIVIETIGNQESSWVPAEIMGNDLRRWQLNTFRIDRISKDFKVLFEVVPNKIGGQARGHVSIDNLRMVQCFPDSISTNNCSYSQVQCTASKVPVCIKTPKICDITVDCDDSEDETLNCDKIPFGGRCDFEFGWCGWQNYGNVILSWARHTGPTPTEKTGPDMDHTHENSNVTGYYMLVNMNQHVNDSEKRTLVGLASNAIMNSVVFNPPPLVHTNASSPYRNSCVVRFYVHQYGMNPGSINLSSVEIREKENFTTTLWWSSKNLGEDWVRVDIILPNVTTKYYLQFEARMGMRIYSDVAIDDFSLSPECFGLNIPAEHLQGYNYWDPRIGGAKQPHKDFAGKSFLELNTCGAKGQYGPTPADCLSSYNNTEALSAVHVIDSHPFKGIQAWKVPNEGYYTIIAKGAGGGLGSGGVGSSRGAMVLSVLELHKDEEIYILVGQSGEHACIKSMGYRDESCEMRNKQLNMDTWMHSKTQQVKNTIIEEGAGGGGGGTYVFLLNSANTAVPLLVAGGGGGLGVGRYLDDDIQHGKKYLSYKKDVSGTAHGELNRQAGPGGGWRAQADMGLQAHYGASLLEGGRGGMPCYTQRGTHGQGGFGGGGGGCDTGGGGGGYSGGDTMINSTNGEGGSSFMASKRNVPELSMEFSGANGGHGAVLIIPAIQGCGCDYRCVALDEYRATVGCICPDGWTLKPDNYTACELPTETVEMKYLIMFFVVVVLVLCAALASLILILYNRYQRKRQAALRHKMLLEQDLQLSRLRSTADDSALTNFNPNYGCDGILNGNVDVKSLPQVARESLRLVKALGQGAFGEVYQGLYRHRDGDAVEMPVAVKTLPEMSTGQAESDFLMEAAIMAKFNHPNIVHLIGVCFDRHPRFIVLELLAGGDLKNFLREGRNKPERPSPLTMKDLIFCALDVAKGCRYMESKRFIHRDIAARNCLLSSKGPGRVVKIADFGMARDIYRSDYYRKGGKAMLPIKWMPPEAFLDGIFTSKTDVWSFGVLLWEVFSLGLMPYTGLPNRDVMQLVTGGGRLDAPQGCPMAVYRIMADCWNPTPEERPSFSNLLERLTTCTQDPEVMNAPLPSFFRPPSNERDTTIMRPPGNDDFCLQVPNSSDYLIPLPGPRSVAERLLSEATGVTIPDTLMTCTPPKNASPRIVNGHTVMVSNALVGHGAPQQQPLTTVTDGACWETSFIRKHPGQACPAGVPLPPPPVLDPAEAVLPPNGPSMVPPVPDVADKLISLDTPQQTPTAIQPPISFSNPVIGELGDGSPPGQTNGGPMTNGNGHNHGPPMVESPMETAKLLSSIPPPITLDPAALSMQQNHVVGTSYANIRMMSNANGNGANHNHSNHNNNNHGDHGVIVDKLTGTGGIVMTGLTGYSNGPTGNGGVNGGNGGGNGVNHSTNGHHGHGHGGNGSNGGSDKGSIGAGQDPSRQAAPFTIQTFSERYISPENHSEISC
ncbi:tyrosine-protein kinase receptor isoform X1 [Anopheles funestus]|uniref:tyrosine-protein kinase receptor isoform X1 n=2 Tax=Anopheles funestus TaxID=62324 RepID=UPI0020C64AEC|nr:tyrosine-protein kinase receptor isoform X1 [Anopheles funestus]XP_049291750.1 tyrosine-protein kinase receptor isoform X1 [Anopheles funestus]XP_049291751.1 tyrosine-protein kinase receptor isoform X1 [Anopheles funestus]XP_049291752.1 tyrosine-protein kinase receptor isoform X1 [Anopheles funestus]XP_049291753.1 tyrosine-protein kinase receptor isoform X1 [Anopheles funestus]